MTEQDGPRQEGSDEEERARYRELLAELRVILPGVQVLLAFLLTVPFSSRFPELDTVGTAAFLTALLGTAVATVILLTPTSYHRIAHSTRRERLRVSVRLTVAGLTVLLLSITAAMFVVARFIIGTALGAGFGAATVGLGALLWYLLPVLRRRRRLPEDAGSV